MKGKVVLLDFWTYGCINCIHIIPDLSGWKEISERVVVIGVHSANSKTRKTENIRRIILRYEIEHPIVNDADSTFGDRTPSTRGLPYLIDPAGTHRPAVRRRQLRRLDQTIGDTIAEFKTWRTKRRPLKLVLEKAKLAICRSRFPARFSPMQRMIGCSSLIQITIESSSRSPMEACSKNRHRRRRFRRWRVSSGNFLSAAGLALDGDRLYVADTENHLIREVDLKTKTVKTIAGTGQQSQEYGQHGPARQIALNSPWICNSSVARSTSRWRGRIRFGKWTWTSRGFDVCGSGREARLDGPRAEAGFAQPSALESDGKTLFVSDAESNIIRAIDLAETAK